ncbi:transposase [Kitasatospora sp. NPDC097691]|uniref:transposase n=1 Tax=Kitasatospora sp. NPDC097691 TaxID=3157231 RepID=UPI003326C754
MGRKRNILTDTIGLLLVVLVTAASLQDNAASRQLLTTVAADHRQGLGRHGLQDRRRRARRHPRHPRRDRPPRPHHQGICRPTRRWIVERTFGWLMNHRRLARDYEALPARSEAMVHVAMISLMTRRLTGESTPTWRGT